MPSYLASEKNDDSLPAPVSCMQQKSMICSQPKVGIDSSEAIRPVGAARHSSVGILAPASTAMTWRKPSIAERREDADVALREHLDDGGAERRLEGGDLLKER